MRRVTVYRVMLLTPDRVVPVFGTRSLKNVQRLKKELVRVQFFQSFRVL
jgi:hypothetical protein